MTRWVAGLLPITVAATAAGACSGAPAACPRAPSGLSAPRLDRCIEPPWIPGGDGVPRPSGWTLENCGDPRTWGFVHRGNRVLSREDLLRTDLRDVVMETGAMYGLAAGTYRCPGNAVNGAGALSALEFLVRLCGATVDDVFTRIAAFAGAHGLADAAFAIKLFVGGQTGPRCARDDPRCGPESNGSSRPGGHCIETAPVAASPPDDRARGRCGHDGDCQITCESFCVSWTEQPQCSKDLRSGDDEEAWCGCVEGKCAWLRRAARAP